MSDAIELVDMERRAAAEMAPVLARAQAFVVCDEQSYIIADAICAEIKMRVKNREVELGSTKQTATAAWKAAVALWKKYVEDPLIAVQTLDRKRYSWRKSEDAKRIAEANALRREQEKKDAEAKLELATRLEEAGMQKQAEAVLVAPIAPSTVVVPVAVAKPAGQTQSGNWTARIVDPDAVPREYCVPSQARLNEYARLMKGKAVCAGVVFEDIGRTSRRGV